MKNQWLIKTGILALSAYTVKLVIICLKGQNQSGQGTGGEKKDDKVGSSELFTVVFQEMVAIEREMYSLWYHWHSMFVFTN